MTTGNTPLRRWRLLLVLAVCSSCLSFATAQQAEKSRILALTGLEKVQFEEIVSTPEEVFLSGHVEIETAEARILADEVRFDLALKILEASGNVVFSFPGAHLAGSRMRYDVEKETGEIEDAVGYLDQDGAILRADKISRVGPQRLKVVGAVFTTCTQPIPYWSFRIASGTFNLGEYAYLKGVAFKTGRVPVFYTPFLAWPIKADRSAGLLFPEFNSSDNLGQSISLPVYWPIADNANLTLFLQYHSEVGAGLGAELDWLPTWRGEAHGDFQFISDRVRGENRYSVEWEQRQDLPRDFRLTSKVEEVSDFDYLTDYETDLRRAASPYTRSTVDITKHWSWYSLSLRAARDEQFFVGGLGLTRFLTGKVVNTQLPEVELRGRSQRIGNTPVFFTFESSVAGFRKQILEPPPGELSAASEDDLITRAKNDWLRADLAPSIQMPLVKNPWIDLQINAGWRGTWYSAAPDPADEQQILDEPVFRNLWNAGLSIAGPRFQRVYDTPGWSFSPKLKHVIEPFVLYQWRPQATTGIEEIILFDDIDSVPGNLSDLRFGIRQRLFGLRAPTTGRPASLSAAEEVSFKGLEEQAESENRRELLSAEEPAVAEVQDVSDALNPTEILSFEISQRYSFIRPLSNVYAVLTDPLTGEDLLDPITGRPMTTIIGSRKSSPVEARLRFNPTADNSVDVIYRYDPANSKLTESSVSVTTLSGASSFFRGSWFRRQPSNPAFSDASSFLRASWGIASGSRIQFETNLDFDLEDGELDHQAYTMTYATQCCSYRIGYDRRDFVDNSRQEYLLVVNLRGLGDVVRFKDSQDD